MPKTSANSLSKSLKGKVLLSTSALAFFTALTGMISYYFSSAVGKSFYGTMIPFLLLSGAVIFFGRWLANEVVMPVEKVSLLAKSFERGVTTSIPKTSGSSESDEILESVVRLHTLIQKMTCSMEEVANGNLDIVNSAELNSDRASQTFSKLLAKAAESIHAKQELEKLKAVVFSISQEVKPLKIGNLTAKVKTSAQETSEISQTLNQLTEQLSEIIGQIKANGSQAQASASEFQRTIQTVIQRDENRVQEMNQASVTLKQIPNIIYKISEELSQSSLSADQSVARAQRGAQIAQENLDSIGHLRRQIQEAAKRVQRLNEHSQEINKISKAVEDLAQRTSMVALNASVQANELGEAGRGFIIVSEEVERLAERAGNTNKHISSLSKTIQAEISEVENSLVSTFAEAANLSKFAIETGSALSELEKHVAGILNLQNKIAAYSNEKTDDTEKAFQIFLKGIAETEHSLKNLKESVGNIDKISAAMDDLQTSVEEFRTPIITENVPPVNPVQIKHDLPKLNISI